MSKDKVVTFKAPKELVMAARIEAAKRDQSLSAYIRDALTYLLVESDAGLVGGAKE